MPTLNLTYDPNAANDTLFQRLFGNCSALVGFSSGATPPASPSVGWIWYDSANLQMTQWTGSVWAVLFKLGARLDRRDGSHPCKSGFSGSANELLFRAPTAMTIVNVYFTSKTTTTSNGTDHWTIQVRNLTQSLNLRSASFDSNGSDFTANVPKDLGLNQNLTIAAGDVIELQVTINGSATAISQALIDWVAVAA